LCLEEICDLKTQGRNKKNSIQKKINTTFDRISFQKQRQKSERGGDKPRDMMLRDEN
jgi:hypothetical protein